MGNSRRAWVYRRGNSWYVHWHDQSGNRLSKSFGSKKSDANEFAILKSAELISSIGGGQVQKGWDEFIADFTKQKVSRLRPHSQEAYEVAVRHFGRICKPKSAGGVNTVMIDRYVAKRLSEDGKKPGSKTSPATVNKELRILKRVFHVARDWKLLKELPKIEFAKEPKVGITFINSNEFSSLYSACAAATKPVIQGVDTADWWRAFLLFTYMTGWRVSEPLKLIWDDVDLVDGFAITRAADNKAGKESRIPLHPLVVSHLKKLKSFSVAVFEWDYDSKQLWPQFRLIQDRANVKKTCRKNHVHNAACEYYGFHDLRRGFATANAGNLTASQLQTLMRHSSYTTTQLYIEMAEQVKQNDVVDRLAVPALKVGG